MHGSALRELAQAVRRMPPLLDRVPAGERTRAG
jgi:hypothetical protein